MHITSSPSVKKLYKLFIFLYVFFLFSSVSMAGYNISWAILSIFLLGSVHKWKNINFSCAKLFIMCYTLFFFTLFTSAILSGDLHVFQKTVRYFIWTLPFWVVFISQSLSFEDKLIKWGSILAIFSLAIYALPQIPAQTRITGYFGRSTLLGTILTILVPLGIMITLDEIKKEGYTKKNILMLAITMLGISTLLFTKTRGAIAGVVFGGILLTAILYKIKHAHRSNYSKKAVALLIGLFAFICIGGIGGYFTGMFHRSYDYERVLLLESSYKMWEDHKIYGVGLGNWAAEYPKYISPDAKEPNLPIPHNVVASFFDETGLIGGIGFTIFVVGTCVFLIGKIKKQPQNHYYQAALWGFIALTCHGMVDAGITNRFAMQFISAVLGLAIASEHVHHIKDES